MKKEYKAPEFEMFRIDMQDVILGSPTEDPIGETIGGGEEPTTEIDLGGDW